MIPLLFLCASICPLRGEEPHQLTTEEKIDLFSEFIGYTLGNELSTMQLQYNPTAIVRGLEKFKAAGKSQFSDMSGEMDLVLQIQEELFEKKAAENLLRTEKFFQEIAKNASLIKIVPGELYFETIEDGHGSAAVELNSDPLVHYSAKTFEDISIANTYEEGSPLRIPLLETVPGFAKGVQGMRIGEKRRLYVHPNLAYRRGGLVPPNSVIIFEVKLLDV